MDNADSTLVSVPAVAKWWVVNSYPQTRWQIVYEIKKDKAKIASPYASDELITNRQYQMWVYTIF